MLRRWWDQICAQHLRLLLAWERVAPWDRSPRLCRWLRLFTSRALLMRSRLPRLIALRAFWICTWKKKHFSINLIWLRYRLYIGEKFLKLPSWRWGSPFRRIERLNLQMIYIEGLVIRISSILFNLSFKIIWRVVYLYLTVDSNEFWEICSVV